MGLYRDNFGYIDLPEPGAFPQMDCGEDDSVTLRLPPGLKRRVDEAAERDGVSCESWLLRTITSSVGSSPLSAA